MDDDNKVLVSVHLPAEVQQQLSALVSASGVAADEVVASALVDAMEDWRRTQQLGLLEASEFERLLRLVDREWPLNAEWFALADGAVDALQADG